MEIVGIALFICACFGFLYLSIVFEDKRQKRKQKEYFQNLEYTLSKVLRDYSEQFNLEENDK